MRGEVHRDSFRSMSTQTTAPVDPKELRPLLHAEIDKLRDKDLALAHYAMQEIQLQRLTDELDEAMDEGWASGRITKESIAAAILEHRRKHPYR